MEESSKKKTLKKQIRRVIILKFIDLINNPSLENKIKFKKQQIKWLKEDIKNNGDNGFGYKKMQIENMEEDLIKLQNEIKGIIN